MVFLKINRKAAVPAAIFPTYWRASRQVDELLLSAGVQAASISRCFGGWMVRIVQA